MCIVGLFFKDSINEWVTFACDGTGHADESKRTKRVQGWSRLNWLGGTHYCFLAYFILINVNAPYARMLLCQLGARFKI